MLQTLTQNIAGWDEYLGERIFGWNGNRVLDTLMVWLTRSGDGYLYLPAGVFLLLFDIHNTFPLVLAGLIAFSIELPVQRILKHTIRRCRPFERNTGIQNLVRPPDKFSFPSGHTAGAFLMAAIFTSLHPNASIPLFVWAGGVGLSRIYNGVHYPTDVLAGGTLGVASAVAGLYIVSILPI
jgi:undecaprenyl-diphosphatase